MTDRQTTPATATDFTNGWFAVRAVHVVDALLGRDREGVKTLLDDLAALLATEDGLPPEVQGRVQGLSDVLRWGLERLVTTQASEAFGVGVGTREHAFLALLASEGPLLNAAVRDKLELSASDASKVGRTLRDAGFVVRRQLGREVLWELTPRGSAALRELDAAEGGREPVPRPPTKLIESNTLFHELSMRSYLDVPAVRRILEEFVKIRFLRDRTVLDEAEFALNNRKGTEGLREREVTGRTGVRGR